MIRRTLAFIASFADTLRVRVYGPAVLHDLELARRFYADAKRRGDTRDIRAASKDLRRARHAQLRMELGR